VLDQYVFNWQTKPPFTADTCTLTLTLQDGSTLVKTIRLNTAGAALSLVADVSGRASGGATAGVLLPGTMSLYVDNSTSSFTTDELARLEDAIAAVSATVAPYGTAVTEVSDRASANIVLDVGTTSAVGGYADGVLGCTTDVGEITLIRGWNWYTGSDPTAFSSSQYDFQTVVTHELGHALGLGHSADASSVMYASLTTGTARRTLTTQDLNVADTDTGPAALHVSIPVQALSLAVGSVITGEVLPAGITASAALVRDVFFGGAVRAPNLGGRGFATSLSPAILEAVGSAQASSIFGPAFRSQDPRAVLSPALLQTLAANLAFGAVNAEVHSADGNDILSGGAYDDTTLLAIDNAWGPL
jgi:hypothetical protein